MSSTQLGSGVNVIDGNLGGAFDQDGEVLGHVSSFDCLDDYLLQGFSEFLKFVVRVESGSGKQALGPGKNRGDGVRGSLLSLLMESVMSSDGTVGSFSLDSSVRALKYGSHESE